MSNLVHIKHVPKEVVLSYAAGTNLILKSKPAVGKSQQVLAAAMMMAERIDGFGFWPFDVTTANPNDVCAYMPDDKTGELRVYPNGALPNAYKDPDAKGIVFKDEPLNGDPATVKVFQKYDNGEDVSGKLRKPDGVIVVGASNRMMDKSGAMQQSRAYLSRNEQLEVFSDAAHNMKFMEQRSWYPTLIKFFEKFPQLIDNYDEVFDPKRKVGADADEITEESKSGIWANMRSWERISKLEYAALREGLVLNPYRVMGNVGRAVGQQYVVYRSIQDKIANVDQILADPKGVAIPDNVAEVYIMAGLLTQLVPQAKASKAAIFINRLPGDMRAMAITKLVNRSKKSRDNAIKRADEDTFDISTLPEFQKWMTDDSVADLFRATEGGKTKRGS